MKYTIGSIGQYVGLLALGIGIGIEIAYKADIGLLSITIGSAIFAAATKIKHSIRQERWWLR